MDRRTQDRKQFRGLVGFRDPSGDQDRGRRSKGCTSRPRNGGKRPVGRVGALPLIGQYAAVIGRGYHRQRNGIGHTRHGAVDLYRHRMHVNRRHLRMRRQRRIRPFIPGINKDNPVGNRALEGRARPVANTDSGRDCFDL